MGAADRRNDRDRTRAPLTRRLDRSRRNTTVDTEDDDRVAPIHGGRAKAARGLDERSDRGESQAKLRSRWVEHAANEGRHWARARQRISAVLAAGRTGR